MIARHQYEHEAINAREYPGTRQLCSECDEPTGRCEEDAIYADDDGEIGPLCESCWHARPEYLEENAGACDGHQSQAHEQPNSERGARSQH